MSLFDATVKQVVKDISDHTLLPVRGRASSDNCKILSLVERKTRKWHLPWKSAYKYVPTELTLNDIILEQVVDVEDLKKSSVLLQNYHSSPTYHKSGKIGGKIAKEFDVDLNAVETMDISLKLGNVTKQEVVWQKLYDATNGKPVKPNHPLVKSIKKRPTKSLFLIGLIVTSGVVAQDDANTMVSGELDVGTAQLSLNLNSSVSSDSKQHKQYTIPRGTTLAYMCYKIKLDKNLLRLQLAEDVTDAPPPQHESRMFSEKAVQSALHHLLSSDVSNDVILMLRKILKNDPSCASKLNFVIEDFLDRLEGEDVLCKITVQHLEKLFSDQVYKDCCALLEKVGFGIYKERNEVIFSGKEELLKSLCALLECLSKMSKYQILALVDCDITHRQAIITIMKIAMQLTDGLDEKHEEPDPVASKFLTAIGVKTEISNGFSVQYLPKNQSVMNLRNITVAVYGMCSV